MIHKTLTNLMFLKVFCGLGMGLVGVLATTTSAGAQEELLSERWFFAETVHFKVYSQLSSRQTSQFITELELWRQLAAKVIQGEAPLPKANVPNHVYFFSNTENFQHFSTSSDMAFFHSTPRANFMAYVPRNESSRKAVLHQYGHFLQNNFGSLQVPRWYEEGMASYLSRLSLTRAKPELERVSDRANELMAGLNMELSMERFLYSDEALASPRLIQIANLKSEALLHFLLHGYQEDQFVDRRDQLREYLEYLYVGRNHRFAFDLAFGITTAQLEQEFERYLSESLRPEGVVDTEPLQLPAEVEPEAIEVPALTLMLGELALNSSRIEMAEFFFKKIIEGEDAIARAYSGLADALRFQSRAGRDQEIAGYFELALKLAPDNPDILLDYGEYWESELQDCEKFYPQVQRQQVMEDIKQKFLQAMLLRENDAEVQLALAEYYLLEGQDWMLGRAHQEQAFSLLPADGFIMEASVKYAIAAQEFDKAERLIVEMSQPIHFFGEPIYVTALRNQLASRRRGENFDACTDFP
jgi:tetratricopeptide (TPR) repeat protein